MVEIEQNLCIGASWVLVPFPSLKVFRFSLRTMVNCRTLAKKILLKVSWAFWQQKEPSRTCTHSSCWRLSVKFPIARSPFHYDYLADPVCFHMFVYLIHSSWKVQIPVRAMSTCSQFAKRTVLTSLDSVRGTFTAKSSQQEAFSTFPANWFLFETFMWSSLPLQDSSSLGILENFFFGTSRAFLPFSAWKSGDVLCGAKPIAVNL